NAHLAEHRIAIASLAEHCSSVDEQPGYRAIPPRNPKKRHSEHEALAGFGRTAGLGLCGRTACRLAPTGEHRSVFAFDTAEQLLLHLDGTPRYPSARRHYWVDRRIWEGFDKSPDRLQLRTAEALRLVLACYGRALALFVFIVVVVLTRKIWEI